MILGISSFTYGWAIGAAEYRPAHPMSETDLVHQTLDFGLSCLQIGDNLPLHTLTPERLHELRTLIESHKLRLEIGARVLTAKSLHQYIDLCTFFRTPLLRFVMDGDKEYEPTLPHIASIIKEFIPELHKRKLTLGIENHDRFKAKALAHLMESVGDDQVGICLDCVNSMGAGEGLEYVADVLSPYTVNLHIKDFTVQRLPHKMGFTITGTPAGKGMTDIPLIMEKLNRYHRCQSAVLEQWVPFGKNLEEPIVTEKKWAEESISFLKSLPYFRS
jgi:3-oxoisoapionate decarboxylase